MLLIFLSLFLFLLAVSKSEVLHKTCPTSYRSPNISSYLLLIYIPSKAIVFFKHRRLSLRDNAPQGPTLHCPPPIQVDKLDCLSLNEPKRLFVPVISGGGSADLFGRLITSRL
ncbi:hypothetical protein DL96DRAFT_1622698, partial [Flagelloscypha sp. PMI_526]